MSHSNETLYYLNHNGKEAGPYTIGQLRAMWQNGTITVQTQYWFEGAAEWQPLIKLRTLLEPLPLAAPPPLPPASNRTYAPVPPPPPTVIYTPAPQPQHSGCTWIIIIAFGIFCGILLIALF